MFLRVDTYVGIGATRAAILVYDGRATLGVCVPAQGVAAEIIWRRPQRVAGSSGQVVLARLALLLSLW